MGRKGIRYSVEQKLFFINLVLKNDLKIKRVACRYHLDHHNLKRWINLYQRLGPDGLENSHTQQVVSWDTKTKIIRRYLND
ncbi:transposase [Sporolactobacillus shoreicorticis]|uniref:Transposase n=1 Tax=Sporolactobacillus shoreicorticis TaxID=1923877 RepID=A0ABW5RZW6_9BACL